MHRAFPFMTFGILQRRQALISAHVQMRDKDFNRDARLLKTITGERLALAQAKEERNKPTMDHAGKTMKKLVHAAASHYMDSIQHVIDSVVRFGAPRSITVHRFCGSP